jgi:HEAT repeat protein
VGLLARPHDVPKKVVVEGPIEPPPPPLPPSYVDLITRKDFAGARTQAEQSLRDEITNGTLQRKGFATEAIGTAHATAGAPMLYDALRSPSADLQVKAAHALGELALPDSAPKLRQALSSAGEKPKTSIAVTLFNLGDKDARPILIRTLSQPALGLEAAIGLADAGDDAGRAMLIDTLATFSPDREVWQHAAHGMIKLGDAATHKRLEGELAQSDGARAVGAAAVLAEATDPKAIDMLARQAADPEFAWSGKAAVALARIGDHRALDWVDRGTASNDADERLQALAILGRLRPPPATYLAVARLADQKLDERVRMTAEAVLLGLRTSE